MESGRGIETGKGFWWFPLGLKDDIQIFFDDKLDLPFQMQELKNKALLRLKKGGSILLTGNNRIGSVICFAENLIRDGFAVKEGENTYCLEHEFAQDDIFVRHDLPVINITLLPSRLRIKKREWLPMDGFPQSIKHFTVDKIAAVVCTTPQKIKNALLEHHSLVLNAKGPETRWAILLFDKLAKNHGVVKKDVKTWSSGSTDADSEIGILIGFHTLHQPPQLCIPQSSGTAAGMASNDNGNNDPMDQKKEMESGRGISSETGTEIGKGLWWFPLGLNDPLGLKDSIQIFFGDKLDLRSQMQELTDRARLTLNKGGSILLTGNGDRISSVICFAENLIREEIAVKEDENAYCLGNNVARDQRPVINITMLPSRLRIKKLAWLPMDGFPESIKHFTVDNIVALVCDTPQQIKNILLEHRSLVLNAKGPGTKWSIILFDKLAKKHGVVKRDVKTWSSGSTDADSEIGILIGFHTLNQPPQLCVPQSSGTAAGQSSGTAAGMASDDNGNNGPMDRT